VRDRIRNILLEAVGDHIPEIKRVNTFRTEEGKFSAYDIDKDVRNRPYMFTVWERKDGYIIRNALVPDEMQRRGIASDFYFRMNQESRRKTGNPLTSTQERRLFSGKVVHELSGDAEALWDSFVRKGWAEKLSEKNYRFII
jgi:predicted GNAT family acetyltransferase